ncbi:hypothetical protein WH297_19305 [Ochrobactrum vermis]|uniref:Uncharacterized protein n=1 Tax=Ochrobactrum vermis TaxID=1827297 RepID=A0ABU8PJP0_9HYPH|nr:hypothetical protein [Ochrobactrum vermis]PQZ26175.1 hypothetical protein CQZ93_19605 [Ochrobactrum vermis]
MLGITTYANYFIADSQRLKSEQSQELQRIKTERYQEVQLLISSMVDFQTFAAAFATEMFDQKIADKEAKTRLVENLNQQLARLKVIENWASPEQLGAVESYRLALMRMIDVVYKTNDLIALGDFYGTASKLTVAKNGLTKTLLSA